MNKFAVVVAVFMFALPAFGAKGVVKHRISGCDYYLVALRSGYALLAWYAGYDPYKGDSLVGEFEEYRIHEIYDATRKDYTTARVVDYRLSKNSALEQLVEKCGTDYQE